MEARETMLQLIPLGMKRAGQLGITTTLESLVSHVTGKDTLSACTDLELFALVRALYAYEAFEDLRAVTPQSRNVLQMMMVTTRDILKLNPSEMRWLIYRFAYFTEVRGLACAAEAGLLDAWLRMLRLWEASQFTGIDNLAAEQARQVR